MNLGSTLLKHFRQVGIIQDLERAIAAYEEAVNLKPSDPFNLSFSLSDLSLKLYLQYDSIGAVEDLKGAIVLDEKKHHKIYSVKLHTALILAPL